MIYFGGFFGIIALICLIFSLTRLIQIIHFNSKLKKNYYIEIPARFDKFFLNKTNTIQDLLIGKTHATPIFIYKEGKEEFIFRGIKTLPSRYKSGQKVTLYQNPKTGKVFDNPNNGKSEILTFFIESIAALILIVFAYCVVIF